MIFSASQIAKFRRCPALYSWEYARKIKPPSTDKQNFGKDVHEHLERYLIDGTIPPETVTGIVARQGLVVLPEPGTVETERAFRIPWNDHEIIGFVDVVDQVHQEIIDHKTTSSLRWAHTEDSLGTDPQGLLYATWAMLELGWPEVSLHWNYLAASNPKKGLRKPAGQRSVRTTIKLPDAEPLIERLDRDLEAMAELLQRDDPDGERRCLDACGAFGGCPHKDVRCKNSFWDHF